MKSVSKLVAAAAVAVGLGSVPQANAQIVMEHNGTGDALLFPVFYGYGENYITIQNNGSVWIQGHLRFRGAVWSGELLDFDVILSPGDVFVIRLADIDGDGFWEIDQTLDPNNFAYTCMLSNCSPEGGTGVAKERCMDQSSLLIPSPRGNITAELITHHRNVGYVEFIGEAVLVGLTGGEMANLLNPNSASQYKTAACAARTGTSAWAWSRAGAGFAGARDLGNVPNVLSGTAFITLPGQKSGVAYNAEALVDFRTASGVGTHRIDNYPAVPTAAGSAVILHHELAGSSANGTSPAGDYVYNFDDNRQDERRISFNNTWGPTLSDGDDSNDMPNERPVNVAGNDSWDITLGVPNSIAEVEEAIRVNGQVFRGLYFDDAVFDKGCEGNKREDGSTCSESTLMSAYFTYAPTKFYYGESSGFYGATELLGNNGYLVRAVQKLINLGKPINVEIWDIEERSTSLVLCATSPCLEPPGPVIGEEVAYFDIDYLKGLFGQGIHRSWPVGRVVISPVVGKTPPTNPANAHAEEQSYPFLIYSFEIVNDGTLSHWRSLHR